MSARTHRWRSQPHPPTCRRLVVLTGLILAGALGSAEASAHSSSTGQSRFVVTGDGAVTVTIDLRLDDVLDLFDVDLVTDVEQALFQSRLESTLPRVLRLSGNGKPCPLTDIAWMRRGRQTVQVSATAACPTPLTHLGVDWGLSAHGSLDLISYAQIVAPGGIEHVAVFSRKQNRGRFVVGHPPFVDVLQRRGPHGALDAIGGALLLLACLILAASERRLLVGGTFVAGTICAGLAIKLVPEAARPVVLGPVLVGLAGLIMAWGPVGLEKRPALARSLKQVFAGLGGLGAGLAVLTVGPLAGDGPSTAVLARMLGGAAPMLAAAGLLLVGRRALDASVDHRQLIAAALGGAAALVSIARLL